MPQLTQLSSTALLYIGAGFVSLVLIIVKWAIDRTLKQVDRRLDERDREREEDALLAMKGQQITCDCLHEIIYCLVNGTHNGGLEQVSQDLEDYRRENKASTLRKAAKYNLR